MGEDPNEVTPPLADQPTRESPSDEPAQIRADIAQTRADMAETIEAIQDKLSPQRIMEQAKDTVHDATVGKVKDMVTSATDTASHLADQVQDRAEEAVHYVRDNPMPAVLIGAGIAWLLTRGRGRQTPMPRPRPSVRPDGRGVLGNNPVPTALAGIGIGWLLMNRGGRSSSPTRSSLPTAGDATRQVRQAMGDATERVQESWQEYSGRVETEFDRWMRENPLTVGAAAVAIGAAVGLAAPRTEVEDAWLGDTRDTLLERAQDVAEDAVGQAQKMVEGTAEQTMGGTSSPGA